MLGNQNNPDGNRLRIYGQNERASSSSSGPKWTSSITDLLVNRSNTMRFNQPQSHQTSQQQLLAQTQGQHASQPNSMHNLHTGVGTAGKGPQTSEGGRLMMKLMNLGAQQQMLQNTHHQPSSSNVSGIGLGIPNSSSTFDHPRLSGSRDDQKRLALDECTNYLQQKTMQQHFPSTSMAISNIINSNRSASSAGIPAGIGAPSSTQASAAAQKFKAFKFNLTMNKQKALSGTTDGPSYSSNAFYQAQMQNEQPMQQEEPAEDSEAMQIHDRQKKQQNNISRGSSQLAMKQHLKQMIKSYEDQPQVHNNVVQDGGDRLHYNETQGIPSSNQDHQHLTYDHSVRKGSAALQGAGATLQPASAKYTGSASSSSKNKPLDRKVHEMEERQKIFEEEIIKRVKEIQSYAKTLHMHLKKIQQTSNKRNEDIQILKEELVQQIKECHDLVASTNSRGHSTLTDQAVHDLLERRLKLADSEVALQIEHLEQKLVKDFDGKLTRQTRATFNEQQVKNDTLKDEILGIITQEFASNLKSEVMRLVGEKMKEAAKAQDKSIHEIRELVLEKAQQIEDVSTETTNYHKDLNLKHDKLQKAVKDGSAHQDQALSSLGDSLRNEIEQVRKRLQSDFKQEIGAMNRNYITQEDLGQELEEFENKIDKVQLQLQEQAQKPLHNTLDQSALNGKLEGLRADLEEQIGQVANELTSRQEQLDQQERQLRSTQEACLQIKSNLASTKAAHDEKVNMLTAKLEDMEMQLEATATRLQQDTHQTTQDPQAILDAIMEQIQPELDNLNDITQQLCQQQESTKQQLHQKIVRSELQEIKQDIDEELKGLQKLIKKQEERVNAVEDGVIGINQVVEGQQKNQMQVQGQIGNLEKQIAQSKVINEQKAQQLTHDLQSKTEDLYDELKEMQQQLLALSSNQQPATPRSESTPERKSRLEAIASLRATLELQISDLSQKINDLEGQLQTLSEQQLSEESVVQAINSALSPVQKQVSSLQTSSSTQLTSLKGHLDDLSDETHSKLNQHDARLSQLEERHLEHQEASTEKPAQNTSSVHYSAQFEDLHSQFVDLKVQLEETAETVNRQEETLVANQKALEGLKESFTKNQLKVREELLEISQDLSTQRELNACLQDVAVTQEIFTQHKTDLTGQLSKLEAKNQALEKSIQDLKLTIATLQRVPQSPQINELDIMRQMAAIEARLAQLESVPAEPKIDHGYQSNMLQVSSPILQQPRRVHQEQSAKLEASHAGHFLEDLSEVISSPNNNNNFANQTQGQDDMLLFNNRSQGSIGRGSVMSNRLANLVSPIGDLGTNHFQFNSQMAGQRLNLDHPQSQDMQARDEDHKEEVTSQEDPASAQQQELPRSASSKHGQSSSSQSQYEERPDEGGFETESPQKDQAPLDPSSQEDEDDDDQAIPLQEINISLESAKQDEEEDLQQAKASQRVSLLASSQKKSRDEVEEESKHEEGSEDMENQNVEEVLQDLRDAEEDQFDRDEDEESKGENLTPAMNVEGEDESMGVNLMSPEPIQHVPISQNHHTAPNQLHQANHFVAFESDEEDAQQYDLVPITNTVSRNAAGPHSASQPPQSIPAPGAHQVRNRYYESGSGEDEVDQPLLNNQDEAAENQEFDNFQVDFQDRPNRPSSQVDLAILRLAHSSPLVEEEEKREAEFDDSPFDAASSQRFDQRFEDEGDVRRPITSLARNNRDRELEQQNQDDPDFQAIQHETLSSHRSSELSDRQGFNSRRSISPNLEHQHNNIDPDDPDEEEIKVQALDLQGTHGDADFPYVQQQTSVLLAGCFPGEESKIHVDEQPSDLVEESEPLSQRDEPEQLEEEDDWNLEDVTASQRLDNLEEEYDVEEEEEEKVAASEGPQLLENQLKSEQVANWIVENELNRCIQALFDLRGYRQQKLKAQNPVFKGGEDLFDVEGSLDWQ